MALVGCARDELLLSRRRSTVVGAVVQQELAAVRTDGDCVRRRELELVQAPSVERCVALPLERHEHPEALGPASLSCVMVEQRTRGARGDRLDDARLRLGDRLAAHTLDARSPEGISHRVAMVEREHAECAGRARDPAQRERGLGAGLP